MSHIILASGSPRRKELLQQVNLPFEVRVSSCEEVTTKSFPHEIVMELSEQKASAVASLLTEEEKEDCCIIGADTIVAISECPSNEEILLASSSQIHGEGILLDRNRQLSDEDIVFTRNDRILGKPASMEDARSMLELLSDQVHQVYTGVTLLCFRHGECRQNTFYEKTDVYFYPLTYEQIQAYVHLGVPAEHSISPSAQKKKSFIEAGWMLPSGAWNTDNGYPPTCMDKAGAYGIQGAAAAFVRKIDGDYNNVIGLPVARLLWEMNSLYADML